MKIRFTTATIALLSVPALSQTARSGVSNPDPITISAEADEATPVRVPGAKPSAAIPARPIPSTARPLASHGGRSGDGEVYGAYVPYNHAAGTAGAADVRARDVERSSAAVAEGSTKEGSTKGSDPDAGVVTSVEEQPGELREGTLLRAHIRQGLSTVTTVPGSTFTAELTEAVAKDGRIVLPVGALIEGRVTGVHGGRRISGSAQLHLQPKHVTLPDGTHYVIHAQLIDTDQTAHTTVDREGTLVRRDFSHQTLAAMGLSTGGAAAAGAVIGGGVGAAVGAGVGAGAGAVLWLKQDRQAVLPEGALVVFSLTDAMPLMPVGNSPVSKLETTGNRIGAAPRGELSNRNGSIVE